MSSASYNSESEEDNASSSDEISEVDVTEVLYQVLNLDLDLVVMVKMGV